MSNEMSHVGWRRDVANMRPDSPARVLAEAGFEGSTFHWKINRGEVQPGQTISREALDVVIIQMMAFIEARVMARWDRTGEPPTHIEIELRVDAA